jgi:hypothetical protein
MATESKATTTRERKATTARQSRPRLNPAETVLEDNPTDPDNGDPAAGPIGPTGSPTRSRGDRAGEPIR